MQQNARIYSLDAIRGIAILCILFSNLPTMTGLDPFNQAGYSGTDKGIRFFNRFVYTSKILYYFCILIWGRIFYLYKKTRKQKDILYISYLAVDCVFCYSLVYSTLSFYGMEIFYTHMP